MEPEVKSNSQKQWMALLLALVIALAVVVVVLFMTRNPAEETGIADVTDGSVPKIGYAQGVTVVDDESSLQAAVDKMFEDAEKEMVASYQNQAVSEDGKTFSCYIANSEYNEYDMYIALYMDLEGDPIFLSGLMRPGEAFREITLDETLDKGTHTVYLAFTQVEDDQATIHGQSVVTLEMTVN